MTEFGKLVTHPAGSFELHHVDVASGGRSGSLHTPHGSVATPAFMPVGTLGTVKGVTIDHLLATGSQMVLGNTYHLTLRPGDELIAELGGLHRFMGWEGPILTDSGGFQIFSLAKLTKVSDDGAVFRAHTDGRLVQLSPEQAVRIQENLGSDVAMVLDHVVALPNERDTIQDACQRTIQWAARCQRAHARPNQSLFAIVQGGLHEDLRIWCAEQLVAMDFAGYAIGGLSVGEPPEQMNAILSATCPALPTNRPRYLMGVGRPIDMLEAIRRGVDMFDCVMPTRNGRNALAFTDRGVLRMRNQIHQRDSQPIDETCSCPACSLSRAYIRHLFMAGEMLGPILLSIHNITYYQALLKSIREAIHENRLDRFYEQKLESWGKADNE